MLYFPHNYLPLRGLIISDVSRQARKRSGTGICHVMLRGVNREYRRKMWRFLLEESPHFGAVSLPALAV